jgi:hypothetical protein
MNVPWADLPTWISAASLLLALSIMSQDRRRQQRYQIERVGTWATLDLPALTVTLNVRNTNDLPIFAVDVLVGVVWDEADSPGAKWVPGSLYDRVGTLRARRDTRWDDQRSFHWSVVPPQASFVETYTVLPPVRTPAEPLATVRCLSLVDTGGRRWRVYPTRAVPPRIIERIHPF